ncbi:unnamed protein product [Schistocephalus solidus]|uniref:Reverse transcriptase domain-containing protein n=1 Tax=Schistocephalus solidus TaxID=70667 RepID=A0A183SU59_SCHSO|nr:unnamed protein product [Schistocephalus solidus]
MEVLMRVSTTKVHDLFFVDDCTLNIVTEEDMQRSVDLFAAGCANFGLTINTAKTVVMHQPPSSMEYNAPRINVNGAQLKMWKLLRTWKAHCHATRESTTRLLNGSPKPFRPSACRRPPRASSMVFT